MILPIVTYGDSILRKETTNINQMTDDLKIFINNMFETLHNSQGVGLSANQVDKSINLFIVDFEIGGEKFKEVFINSKIIEYSNKQTHYNEGCLSIPGIKEDVLRPECITISYYDLDFNHHLKIFDGIIARVIQHEYDHTKGIVFIDNIDSINRSMLTYKLKKIINKKVSTNYKIK